MDIIHSESRSFSLEKLTSKQKESAKFDGCYAIKTDFGAHCRWSRKYNMGYIKI